MQSNQSGRSVEVSVVEETGQWFVRPADRQERGPYHTPAVALEVAAVEVLSIRKRGMKADIVVHDDYGTRHICHLIEQLNDPGRCPGCEHAWSAALHARPPRCLLRKALASR